MDDECVVTVTTVAVVTLLWEARASTLQMWAGTNEEMMHLDGLTIWESWRGGDVAIWQIGGWIAPALCRESSMPLRSEADFACASFDRNVIVIVDYSMKSVSCWGLEELLCGVL